MNLPLERTWAKLLVKMAGPAFFAVALGLSLIDIFYGFWDHDGGFYLTLSALVAKGFIPYVDFVPLYPPLFLLINSIPVALHLDRFFLAWAIPWAWIAMISGLTVVYVRRALPGVPRWIPWGVGGGYALFCIDFGGNHLTLEHGVTFFGLLMLLVHSAKNMPGHMQAFWWGVFASCAFLTKQVGILLLFPFLFCLKSWRQAGVFVLGGLLPVIGVLFWIDFDIQGVLKSWELLSGYVSGEFSGMFFYREPFRTPFGFFLLGGLAILCVKSLTWYRRQEDRKKFVWLMAWSMVGAAYYVARARNNFPHYTLSCWPAICVAFVAAMTVLGGAYVQKILLRSCGIALVFSLVFIGRVKDMDKKPYSTRWIHGGKLPEFLRPVAADLSRLIPEGVETTQIGLEEFGVFFLADRLPSRKGWGNTYLIPTRFEGSFVLDHPESDEARKKNEAEAREHGYREVESWHYQGRSIVLYEEIARATESGI